MVHNSKEVISHLIIMTSSHIAYAKQLLEISEDQLQFKQSPKSWCALECLEHLNRYASFYNTEINKRMNASSLPFSETFKSTYLGNKFSNDMLPKEGMKTMNTFKSKNPNTSTLDKEQVLLTFIKLQGELLTFLNAAYTKNLDKIKTYTTLPILKFKLGDTFRFVIFHNERHIQQAKKVLNSL
ncbi:MAG: DinB family protein [Flavobacteriaceae bacterium]